MSIFIIYFLTLMCFITSDAHSQTLNGFDLSNLLINKNEIFSGGPPRDGIPSIDKPKFIAANKVDFLNDDDIVIGLTRGETARAYPTRILVWHEIVNDVISNEAVVVTYCPLCGTAMVFDRNIGGKLRHFGVSGLLYQSDVLMYDRETESLWSQLAMKAVSGVERGHELKWLPSEHLTWKAWSEKYPNGEVLSTDTGYQRNYNRQAYASYFASDDTMFPVPIKRNELSKKSWVVGTIINGKAKAYAINDLVANQEIHDKLANTQIVIRYNAEKKFPKITNIKGEPIASVVVFWFAWQAFYPNTLLYSNSSQ
jgi:hypothetical protein